MAVRRCGGGGAVCGGVWERLGSYGAVCHCGPGGGRVDVGVERYALVSEAAGMGFHEGLCGQVAHHGIDGLGVWVWGTETKEEVRWLFAHMVVVHSAVVSLIHMHLVLEAIAIV